MKTFSRIFIITLFFVFLAYFSYAQSDIKKAEKLLGEAMGYIEYKEYNGAIPLLEKADSLDPHNPKISYYLGKSYIEMKEANKAYKHIKEAVNSTFEAEKMDFYWAVALHSQNKFQRAINMFNDYKNKVRRTAADNNMIKKINKYISWCKNGQELVRNKIDVTINNLSPVVNSKYPEYRPIISADKTFLIFTSRRPNTTGGKVAINDNLHYEDIYYTRRNPDSAWKKPKKFSDNINTPGHEACAGLSPDGQKIFIYKSRETTNPPAGDIYVSNLKGDTWSEPKKLSNNINTKGYESSVSITPNEDVLFFSSNRKGGYGGTDIYMSRRLPDNTWGKAINLGPEINTSKDEDGPFIHPDGETLYFSSEGHNTMGGYDIFKCKINTKKVEIENMENAGYPINTTGDDIFFSWSADGKNAYFASKRRKGQGYTDIYVLTTEDEEEKALVVLKGKVLNCVKDKALASTITVTDKKTGELLGIYNSNSSTGKYLVILPAGKHYKVKIQANHFKTYSENIDIPNLDHYKEIKENICLKSKGFEKVSSDNSNDNNKALSSLKKTLENVNKDLHSVKKGDHIILNNVYYDFNKATLRKESEKELNRLAKILKEHKNMKIEIIGHTDSKGSKEFNKKLSIKRAKSVVDYLVNQKGIDKEKLEYRGKGESDPLAPNDTKKGRQLNRRTTFEVLTK